jgi:hypothetical protein
MSTPTVLLIEDTRYSGLVGQTDTLERALQNDDRFTVERLPLMGNSRTSQPDFIAQYLIGDEYPVVIVPDDPLLLPAVKAQHIGSVVGYGVRYSHNYDAFIRTLEAFDPGIGERTSNRIAAYLQ